MAILVSGYLVSQENMIIVMYPFKYLSPNKWAYQVYVLNEYNDLTLNCSPKCDPIQSLGFKESMEESIWATAILGVTFYISAFVALILISKKFQNQI